MEPAVRVEADLDDEAAVEALATRLLRVIQVADALDLGAPVFQVTGVGVFARARADVELARRAGLGGVAVGVET